MTQQDSNDVNNPVRADQLKAGERFRMTGIEYQIVSITRKQGGAIRIEAVRPDGTGPIITTRLQGDDLITLTHRIPDEW